MFDISSINIPDNIDALFGAAGQSFNSGTGDLNISKLRTEQAFESRLSQGTQPGSINKSNISKENDPTATKAAASEDPQAVEDRWTARLAKYAGIAGATGVKLGGM